MIIVDNNCVGKLWYNFGNFIRDPFFNDMYVKAGLELVYDCSTKQND